MDRRIRFNEPYYTEKDVESVRMYLLEGTSPVKNVQQHLKERTGAKAVFLTAGATSAMDLFFAASEYPEGGEVVMPSYTFPAAANAVIRAGLKPVFTEIDAASMVISMDDIKRKTGAETCCIMPMHYGGASVDMDDLLEFASNKGVDVFEDSALSYLAYYKNIHLGTLGRAGVLSFHNTKNLSGDGGGALLLNDESLIEKAAELLANGTNRPAFIRNEVSEYSWQRAGAGTAMSGLSAALLDAQLAKDMEIKNHRGMIWNTYFDYLKTSDIREYAELPVIPDFNENNNHVFYLRFEDPTMRESVRRKLNKKGIEAVIHYKPLHESPMGLSLGNLSDELPVTHEAASCLLRLPLHMYMTEDDASYICMTLMAVLKDA